MRFLISILAAIFCFSSCTSFIEGSDNITEKERGVARYTAVSVEDGLNIIVSNDQRNKVVVMANDNIHQYIETSVKGETLFIGVKRGAQFTNAVISIKVSGVGIKSISGSGGSSIEVLRCPFLDMAIDLSGGSSLFGIIDAENIDANISGGSELNIQGVPVQHIRLESSGGSNSYMQIEAKNIDAKISGGSRAYLWVSQVMNIDVSGGSTVYYKGGGTIGNLESSGASQIIHKDW